MSLDGSVVIALDGSPHSEQTLEWGMTEASLRGAGVVLARVCPDTLDINRLGWYPLLDDEVFESEAREYLAATLTHARERWPGATISSRLLVGPEVPVLREASSGAELLVIGARGRSGHLHLGSTGSHVASHAHCPVAVVRDAHAGAGDGAPVVAGMDGSTASLTAARAAAHEAELRGVPLVVVHARPTRLGPYGDVEPEPDASVDPAGVPRTVEGVARLLRTAHPGLEIRVDVRFDDPPHALVDAGRDAQLVVVGSRGLGAFRGLLLGSVSAEVLRLADTTVMVVRTGVTGPPDGHDDARGGES